MTLSLPTNKDKYLRKNVLSSTKKATAIINTLLNEPLKKPEPISTQADRSH